MAEEKTQTEELSEEAKLAQEALEATPDEPAEKPDETGEKPEDKVPATVVARQRAARREAELEAARLRGENEALRRQQTVKEKSPLELAAEQQGCSIDEVEMTGKLYREQKTFDDRQTAARNEEANHAQQKRDYDVGLTTIPADERDELIALGGHLLTDGDKQNIWGAGRNSGKELKRILTHRIIQAGGEGAAILQSRTKPKKKDKPKTETEEKNEEKNKTERKEEAPEIDEVFDPVTERAFQCFQSKKK